MDTYNLSVCWGPTVIFATESLACANYKDIVTQSTEATRMFESLLLFFINNPEELDTGNRKQVWKMFWKILFWKFSLLCVILLIGYWIYKRRKMDWNVKSIFTFHMVIWLNNMTKSQSATKLRGAFSSSIYFSVLFFFILFQKYALLDMSQQRIVVDNETFFSKMMPKKSIFRKLHHKNKIQKINAQWKKVYTTPVKISSGFIWKLWIFF